MMGVASRTGEDHSMPNAAQPQDDDETSMDHCGLDVQNADVSSRGLEGYLIIP